MKFTSNYTVTIKIDTGGAYAFYQAVRISDGLPVYIKLVSTKNLVAVKSLEEEFEISQQLESDWAIPAIALERNHDEVALVFADYQGENIHHFANGKPIALNTFLKIAINIAGCVSKMHEKGIVHKDIKPSNILINPKTNEIRLIDFSIASVLPFENNQAQPHLHLIEGSLPYMSPEQTGRMNRFVDFRSDLYSLGISFYEMLTGKLPFSASDPLEWVYCHVAQTAEAPVKQHPELPKVVSNVVMKLLAKTAEDRYQTAAGLQHDLQKCLTILTAGKELSEFPLGEKDISHQFNIGQKLYGREKELAELLQSFERMVATGKSELVLISGYSGVGKTSLVNELQKPILKVGGLFISGKLDQYKRGIPYFTIVEAFKGLIKNILFQPESQIEQWRQLISDAVGINGQVILDIIPQAELIMGQQEPLALVSPMESKIRFEAVLQKFIRVFASPEHPLVLFLDDLQWVDMASLDLIKQIITNADNNHILLVGAYRDNEINPAHPLAVTIDEIKNLGTPVNEISLHPLSKTNLQHLIADTLSCNQKAVTPLAGLVHKKTAGNPFFVIQFLKTLHREHLLLFNTKTLSWDWKIEEIENKDYTENVVDLMTKKIKQLPVNTQTILKLAACVGNKFETQTLANLVNQKESEISITLRKPLQEGLLLKLNGNYGFAHDKIHQATYSLLSESERAQIHSKIGNRLLKTTTEADMEEAVFVVANHFSQCAMATETEKSKILVANLYLKAGKKARASAAYQAAEGYFKAGIELLPSNGWKTEHQLTFQLYLELSACEYLLGNFQVAEKLFADTLAQLQSPIEKAGVYNIQLELYHILGKFEDAAVIGLNALKMLGLPFPETEVDQAAYGELLQVQEQLKEVKIDDLLHRPIMSDPVHKAAMEILMNLYAPFYNSRPHLLGLLTFRMTNYSLQYGNTASSPYAFVYYGILLGTGMGDYKQGQAFGDMALALNEKLGHRELWCKVLQTYGTLVHPWSNPMHTCLPYLHKSYLSGLETGDLIFSGFSVGVNTYLRIINGHNLQAVFQEAEKYLSFFKRSKDEMMFNAHRVFVQHCLNIIGETNSASSLSSAGYDEELVLTEMHEKQFAYSFHWYYLVKMQVLYHNGEYTKALEMADKIKDSIPLVHFAQISVAEFYFYYALTFCALYPEANQTEKQRYQEQIELCLEKLKTWASHSSENFRHKCLLISAELGNILQADTVEVMTRYEDAIKSARENHFMQNEALAYELAARYYRNKGFPVIEESYSKEARDLYLNWGAKRKAAAIESRYPAIREKRTNLHSTNSGGLPVQQLDVHAIIKAAQAISSNLVLNEITESLMRVVMEQAGAQKGTLLLDQNNHLTVAAEASLVNNKIKIKAFNPLKTFHNHQASSAIIQYVKRTKEKLIHQEGVQHHALSLIQHGEEKLPLSVACLPIIKQSKLVGILYLENNLFSGAFTDDKVDVLEILAAQVAISIENAFFLDELTRSESQQRMTMKQLPGVIWTTDKLLNITSSQGSMLSKLELETDELVGVNLVQYFGTTDPDFPATAAHKKALTGESERFEIDLNGFILEAYVEPLKNSNEEIIGCVGVAFDITERVNYIKTIEDKNEKLKEIAWIQSHLVRAPVSRIMGLIDLLKMPENPEVEVNKPEVIDFIVDSAMELDKLIHEIVDKTKQAGK